MSSLRISKSLSLREVQRQARASSLTKSPMSLQHGLGGSPTVRSTKFNTLAQASSLNAFLKQVADDDGTDVSIMKKTRFRDNRRAVDAEALEAIIKWKLQASEEFASVY
ncbi:hypothetical protein OWV82_022236 [Melia azedarach]|uniref:Uncharacterized protein n=1 Tax=Melia azedarach TaxID=155640 RepID=A0ACC1X2E0_MELAZ|nr:hypothetical protein OWV82_022236 [Melia azedarach]